MTGHIRYEKVHRTQQPRLQSAHWPPGKRGVRVGRGGQLRAYFTGRSGSSGRQTLASRSREAGSETERGGMTPAGEAGVKMSSVIDSDGRSD